MRKPNLFLIGGPKCGTTSLQEYLAGHPQIFMSNPKEPCYFDSDLPFPKSPRNEAEYLRCFDGVTEQHAIVGEASSNYLFSRVAVPSILRFNPDARFIVMLRNPISMSVSLHGDAVKTLLEDELDFRAAWNLQVQRRQGRALPHVCYQKEFVLYGDFCKLGEQLRRLYGVVSRERVHVIFFDDFSRDARQAYCATLRFLGLPDDGRIDFPVRNVRVAARSRALRSALTYLLAIRNRLPVPFNLGLISTAIRLNSREAKRPVLPLDFHRELAEYFRSDIELLATLTNRDLTHWLSPPAR